MDIDFENLITLQKLDKDTENISLLLEKIPNQLKEIDNKIEDSSKSVAQTKEKMAQNQKRRRELEAGAKDIREKMSKYKRQLNEVKTNIEYTTFLKEISEAQKKVDALEEEIISEMLLADDIEEEIKKVSQKNAELTKKFSEEKKAMDKDKNELEAKRDELIQKKENLIPKIPNDQIKLYNNIYKKKGGIALSPIKDEFCSMCHMRVRPQVLNELIGKEKIILCENCGRILYWQKESK